ncbi:AAA family ATPase [Candidatus Phytoplasma gossypii]|uniref:AAA family ATPase n=1 Tax=Candidatus Phytoplasma gossypii TaxID=2982629 RepID=A0ABT9D4A4_9MOLU|nr:AAA family ATPase ['Gossypium sp.' phytoplasma]MDO8057562.1 AAA family ATPase ['Gossypium sp.' phytoplasma]
MKIKKNYLFFFVFFCFFAILIFLFWYNVAIKSKNINLINFSLCNSKLLQEQEFDFEDELKQISAKEFKVLTKIKNTFPQYFQESNEDKNNFLLNQILLLILGEFKNHNYKWFDNYKKSNLFFTEYLSTLDKYDLFNDFGYKIEEIVSDPDKYVFILPGNYIEFANYDKYLFSKKNSFSADTKGLFWKNWSPKNLLFISKSYLDIILQLSTKIWEFKNNPNQQSFVNELNILGEKHFLLSKADTDVHFIKHKIKKLNTFSSRESETIRSLTETIQAKETQYRHQMDLSEAERQQLKREIGQLTKDLITSQEKIDQHKNDLEKAQKTLSQTSSELEEIRKELEKDHQLSETTIHQLKSELDSLNSQHDNLNVDLKKAKQDNQELKQKLTDNIDIGHKFIDILEVITSSFLKQLDKQTSENIKNNSLNVSAQKFAKDTSKMPLFGQLIGLKKEKAQLQEYLNYLRDTNKYFEMGVKKPPKGIILYGPPGTGKTHLAEAFARESGLSVFSLSSSDFSKTYVGEAPRLIENIFIEARKKFPSIILIDECESVFRSRVSNSLTTDHGNVIAAFLSYLEGVHEDKERPVFVIAMTNILEEIDSAILSRFDKRIKVDLWDFSSIQEFLKLKAIDYKLDLMAYDYLVNNIPEIIFKLNNDELKTPRGLISLLNQAVTISQNSNHQHSYVKLIDLQLSLDLKLGLNSVNWDNHQHQAYTWQDLAFIKEYNGISIKQLFEDNNFEKLELKYYKLIKDKSQNNKKPIYISLQNDVGYLYDIDIDSNNMWPSNLLGFYLDVQNVVTDNFDFHVQPPNLKISNPEDLLRLYIRNNNKYKVNRIYFVWDLFKQQEINFLLFKKWGNLVKKYPFLKQQYQIMKDEVNSQINSLKDLELNKLFHDWIKKLKNKWIEEVMPKIKLSPKTIYDLFKLNLINLIEEEIDLCWQKDNLSKDNCLEQIIMRLNENFSNLFKNFLRDETIKIINKISLNKKIFSQFQIEKIKEYLKQTTIQEFEKELDSFDPDNILSEEILTKIFVNQEEYFNQQDSVYYKLWQEKIYKYLDISLPHFEQLKLKKYLIHQLIETYFQQDLELDKIIEHLNEKIDIYKQQFEQKLEKKINQIVNKYFLSNYFQDSPDLATISLINKRANIWINHNLKSDEKIKSEKEIENIVLNFLQKYTKNLIINQQKRETFLERNFVKIIVVIFLLLFCVFYFLCFNNLKK